MIRALVGFDTTSVKSNLPLIDFVRDYLADYGVDSRYVLSEDGTKANLWATVGPDGKADTGNTTLDNLVNYIDELSMGKCSLTPSFPLPFFF